MKTIQYLHPHITVVKTKNKGRGVLANKNIPANTVLEIAPVIVMKSTERKLLDLTLLHDYIFEWGNDKQKCCVALGYISLYNHAYQSNCEYEMNFKKQIITVKTVKDVRAGEELCVNYNGDWNSNKKIWFDTK
ncbi:MAG TPA: SET domain-containing protein [Chitinophagaceae bacterium]|nr:SET domain-containing protein [Chitinophagaceae bacterium]